MFLGSEKIKGLESTGIKDFWQWIYSDLLIKKNRNDFGLFIVAHALDLTKMPRINWGNIDLRYRKKKISVECSAYVQSWRQKHPKRVSYSIAPKKGITAAQEDSVTFRNREAEVYIFGLLVEKEVAKIDVLNMEQWKFYILRTETLNEQYYSKKKIGLRELNKHATPVHHSRIKAILDDLIDLELTEKLVL